MAVIDTHAHLTSDEFQEDLDIVVSDSIKAGVEAIITVSEDLEDARKALELGQRFDSIYPAAGLFPTHTDFEMADRLANFIRENAQELIAIGEVGLDFWKVQDPEGREIQIEILKRFIRLSKELDLPLNCHCRSAGRRIIELLVENGAEMVQIHAFDAKAGAALIGQEAGFFFSIPPSVIRSKQKQRLVRALSLSSILIETDSPVLGPDPGRRNTPKNALLVLDAISSIKGEPREKVMEICLENTKRIYARLGLR